MKSVLITGATGMLGHYICDALDNAQYEVLVVDRSRFDLSNPIDAYQYVVDAKPDAILHLAAETDVDLCERDPQRAAIRNHLATEMIARAAKKCGSWILYMSSSNVFGGEGKHSYNELDLPLPINYYGRSKLFGEMAVRTHCPIDHLIVRAGWMIGGGQQLDHKFVGKIVKQIKEGAISLRAVSDRFGTITPANLLSDFLVWALAARQTGTLHFGSSGTVTRLDIARAIAEFLEFKGSVDGVASSLFPLSAPRPLSEAIESIYLPTLHDAPKPGFWRSDLEKYVSTFNS